MRIHNHSGFSGRHLDLIAASEAASRAIPPLWPLSSSVAAQPVSGAVGQVIVRGISAIGPRCWRLCHDAGHVVCGAYCGRQNS